MAVQPNAEVAEQAADRDPFESPPGGRRNTLLPPPGCTGETYGDNPAFRTDADELVIVHPGGMKGREACPWCGPRMAASSRACTCRQFWIFGGAPHAPSCPDSIRNADRQARQ